MTSSFAARMRKRRGEEVVTVPATPTLWTLRADPVTEELAKAGLYFCHAAVRRWNIPTSVNIHQDNEPRATEVVLSWPAKLPGHEISLYFLAAVLAPHFRWCFTKDGWTKEGDQYPCDSFHMKTCLDLLEKHWTEHP